MFASTFMLCLAFAFAGFTLPSFTHGVTLTEITDISGGQNDYFGWAVSASGTLVVVGAIGETVGGNPNQGQAYLFDCTNPAACTLQSPLKASDGAASDFLGSSVSISGHLIAVGAYGKTVGGNPNQGQAYLFDCTNPAACVEQSILVASDGAAGDTFGWSISFSGNIVAVGAYGKTVGGNTNQGQAYLFDCTNPTACVEQSILVASDGAVNDNFGSSVSISGNLLAVGAYGKTVGSNSNQGQAYLFDCTNPAACVEQSILDASDGAALDMFGYAVSISDNLLAVGAYGKTIGGNPTQGQAYLFDCTNSAACVETSMLVASDGTANNDFGRSINLSGNLLAVGADGKTVGANSGQGQAYLFDCTNPAACVEQSILVASDGAAGDFFGTSVSLSGNLLAVGARAKQVGGEAFQGIAYVGAVSACGSGQLINGNCACPSGLSGPVCLNVLGPCPQSTPALLTTGVIAEFMSSKSFINNNDFIFTVESPAVLGRIITSLSLNPSNTNCTYPGPNFVKGFDSVTCQDSIMGSIDIQDIGFSCDWVASSDQSYTYLTGRIDVTAMDPLGNFNGIPINRVTHASLGVQLAMPFAVTVTTVNLTVASPITTLAAVTGQDFNPVADLAMIEITTSVQWPWVLDLPIVQGTPNAGFGVNISLMDASGCDQFAVGSACTQIWQVNITSVIESRACVLDGNYTFDWQYNCSAGISGPCAVDGTDFIPSVVATLASEDGCAQVQIFSAISGSLASYSDSSFGTPQLAFVGNADMFFQAAITADVLVSSVSISGVTVIQGGSNLGVASSGVGVDPSLNYQEYTSADPNVAGFSFAAVLADSHLGFTVFDSSLGQSSYTFTVSVDLVVTYLTTFGKKRDVESKVITVSKDIFLDASHMKELLLAKAAANAASNIATYSAGAVMAAAAAGMISFI